MTADTTQLKPPGRGAELRNSIIDFLLVKKGNVGFRTFHGVFLPIILSLLGVILFLRLGWIVGEMGMLLTTSMIVLGTSITLITACSVSASATNMRIGFGGVYFIISRSFGVAIGSAIGLPLYCAQAIGIAFYIMGFAESLHYVFPFLNLNVIEFSTLACLGMISIISTSIVMRTQFLIFIVVLLAISSFFLGVEITDFAQTATPVRPTMGYWAAFALFFPGVTGLESGVAMSGDLKNPQRSLPLGSISAILMGFVIYLAVTTLLWMRVPRELLLEDSMIMETVALSGPLVLIGIFGATLACSLGAIMAAPRTLQAISNDGIVPKVIGKEFGKDKEPRIASFITLCIVALCLYLGDLNYIAPVLTMFFLISYGMLNLATGLESLMNNPSWRPTIYIPASLSLLGASLCIMTMLLIDASYTLMAGFFVLMIYVIMKRRLKSEFDDIRQGLLLFFLRKAIYKLSDTTFSARSWRPNVLAFTRSLSPSSALLDFTSGITGGKGFLTLAHCYQGEQKSLNIEKMKGMIKQRLAGKNIESMVEIVAESDLVAGFKNTIMGYGLSPLRPNTIVVNVDETNLSAKVISQIADVTYKSNKNLILLADNHEKTDDTSPIKQIDIWWDDEVKDNNDLMIVLAHMYCNSSAKKYLPIHLNSVVKDEVSRQKKLFHFTNLLSEKRLNIHTNVYVSDKEGEKHLISQFSKSDGMAFIGIRSIEETETLMDYEAYLKNLLRMAKKYKIAGLFLAAEKIELDAIICSIK